MFKMIAHRSLVLGKSMPTYPRTSPGLFLSNELYPALGKGGHASLSLGGNGQHSWVNLEMAVSDTGRVRFSSENITLPMAHHEGVRFYVQQIFDDGTILKYFSGEASSEPKVLIPRGYQASIFAEEFASKTRKVHQGDAGQHILNEHSALNNLSVVLKLIQTLLGDSAPKSKLGQLVLAECFVKRINEIGGEGLYALQTKSQDPDFYNKYCKQVLETILDSNFILTVELPSETQEIDTKVKIRHLQDIALDFKESEAFGFDSRAQLTGQITLHSAPTHTKSSFATQQVFRFSGDTFGDSSSDPAQKVSLGAKLHEESNDDETFGFDPRGLTVKSTASSASDQKLSLGSKLHEESNDDETFGFDTNDTQASPTQSRPISAAEAPRVQVTTTPKQVLTLETASYKEGSANNFLILASKNPDKASLKQLLTNIDTHFGQKTHETVVDDLLDEVDMDMFASAKDKDLVWVKSVFEKIMSNDQEKAISQLRENPHNLDVYPLLMKLRYTGLQQVVDDIARLIQLNQDPKKWNASLQRNMSDLLKKGHEMERLAKERTEKEDKGIISLTWNQVLPTLYLQWTDIQSQLNASLPGLKK